MPKRHVSGSRSTIRAATASLAVVALIAAGAAAGSHSSPSKWVGPATKEQRLERAQAELRYERSQGRSKSAFAQSQAGALPTDSPSPWRSGIVDMQQGPFPAITLLVRNVYGGPVGDRWLLVYAGGVMVGSPPDMAAEQVGALRVYMQPPTPDTPSAPENDGFLGEFRPPNPTGALTITSVDADTLVLQNGETTLRFDMDTLQFEGS